MSGGVLPPTRRFAAAGKPGTVGISLSGGGIRSAAYSLGVLQALGERGLLKGKHHADYLSAVSGGSYITGALTMVAKGPFEGEPDADRVVAAEDPFARGTPEERFVRDHTTYLAHGTGGKLAFVGRLLGGILLQLLFLVALIHTVLRPVGWLYGLAIPTLQSTGGALRGREALVQVVIHPWSVRLVLAMAAAGVVLGSVSIARRFNDDEWRVRLGWAGAGLLIAAAVVATTVIGVPKLLEFLREQQANRHGGRFLRADAAGASLNALLNLVGASTGALVVTGAWAMRLGRGGGAVGGTERWIIRKLKPLAQKLSMMGLNLAAMLTGPVFLVAIAVVCLDAGSQHPAFAATDLGGNSAELGWVGLSAILFLALYVFGDLVAWSLHPLYKRRLSGTFALRRRLPPDSNVPLAEPRPYKFKYRLSDSQPDQFPRVLISATLNVTDYGLTSTGSNAVGFVFSTDKVGCDLTDRVPTADYEAAFNSRLRDFTLPTAVSITGAAVSPAMGKMTRKPIRFLLALLNIRLGVWVPNPMRMTEGGTKRIYGSYGGPSLWLLVNELFGRYHLDAKFLYVSDGGHYENMGLVELLRRGCTTVWAVDASGDSISTFHTFSEAVALARAELGVEINLDPSAVMAPDPKTPSFVRSAHAVGDIRYQDGTTGHIVLIKAGVPADAPYDVRDFHASHPGFPCDPTINQLYTGERFEAYRSLGYFAGSRALAEAADADGDPLAPVTAEAG